MRALMATGAVIAFGLSLWGCGGSGYTSGNPTASTPPPTTSGVVTVNVVGVNGALSFSPNPASLPAGQMIVWHNVDTIAHRVVFNDRSVDTGNLAAGTSSQPQQIAAAGGQYHCAYHPVMVGGVNQDSPAPAPCQGSYCD
jgi:plastocyanin